MLSCPVLRCTNRGAAFVMGSQGLAGGYREAYVCVEHKALIDAGSPWYMDGHWVLMGDDIPPVLEGWSACPSIGADGFTLTLHIVRQAQPIKIFLTPTEARTLALIITSATNGIGPQRLETP